MSAASERNLSASARERERRLAMSLDSPGTQGLAQAAYLGPSWDAFYGSLREGGSRLSGAGMAAPDSDVANSADANTARTLGINHYLGDLTDQRRLTAQQLQQEQARTDLTKTAAAEAASDLAQREQMDRSLAPIAEQQITTRTPGVDDTPDTITMRPATRETSRARLLASVPGHLRPQIEAQLAASDAKLLNEQNDARKLSETERHNKAGEAAASPFAAITDPTGAPVTGPDVLARVPPQVAATVKAVIDGRQALPSGTALKDPYWKGIIGLVQQTDPTFDAVNFNARNATRQDFTKGKAAGQINAINTVIGHLSDLADTGGKLGNTGLNWANAVYNKLTPGGSERGVHLNNFETLKEGVANELMRVWRQVGAGSEKEIEDWKATIGSTKSPEELQGAFKTIGGMLESKLGALDSQYKQGMGTDKVTAVTPESRKRLDTLQGLGAAPASGGTVMLQPPGGGPARAVPADQVDHYLKLGATKVGG